MDKIKNEYYLCFLRKIKSAMWLFIELIMLIFGVAYLISGLLGRGTAPIIGEECGPHHHNRIVGAGNLSDISCEDD